MFNRVMHYIRFIKWLISKMPLALTATWSSSPDRNGTYSVLPDGCHDLILKLLPGQAPRWHISPLFDQAESIKLVAHSQSRGFRFRPGTQIDEAGLFAVINQGRLYADEVEALIPEFAYLDSNVEEALACISNRLDSVTQIANELGVSPRTLQRHLLNYTGKSPSYWLRLMRARAAAKASFDTRISNSSTGSSGSRLSQIAYQFGYSDQAHMNREFQVWFKESPAKLGLNTDYREQIIRPLT